MVYLCNAIDFLRNNFGTLNGVYESISMLAEDQTICIRNNIFIEAKFIYSKFTI